MSIEHPDPGLNKIPLPCITQKEMGEKALADYALNILHEIAKSNEKNVF